MSDTNRRAMLGYVIDESIQVGDMCWQGPLKLVRGQMAGALFTSADNDVLVIPDVPNLAHIARFLADHPETVDALGPAIDHLKGMIPEYEKWEASAIEQPADVLSQEGRDLMSKWVVDAKSQFALLSGLAAAMRGEGGHE